MTKCVELLEQRCYHANQVCVNPTKEETYFIMVGDGIILNFHNPHAATFDKNRIIRIQASSSGRLEMLESLKISQQYSNILWKLKSSFSLQVVDMRTSYFSLIPNMCIFHIHPASNKIPNTIEDLISTCQRMTALECRESSTLLSSNPLQTYYKSSIIIFETLATADKNCFIKYL